MQKQEVTADPVKRTLGTHGASVSAAHILFGF